MKQRSWVPAASTSAAIHSSCGTPTGRRLIFWPPNFSATRERGAEILPLHAEHALVPGGHDLHVAAVDDEVVQPVDREAHQADPFGRRAVTSISMRMASVCSPAWIRVEAGFAVPR